MTRGTRRDFRGRRLMVNSLRAMHLVGAVGCGAGILAGLPGSAWASYAWVLIASGLGMMLLDGWSDPDYSRQLTTLVVLIKIAAFAAMMRFMPSAMGFWLVLVVSAMISHAPSRLRHWRWWP